jgi:hypothetical protein
MSGVALISFLLTYVQAATPCDRTGRVTELLEEGDAFRAVSLLKETEFSARGSAEGYLCLRRLLGVYLDHEEWEWASKALDRFEKSYSAHRGALAWNPALLRAELLLMHGNWAGAADRLSQVPSSDRVQELKTFSLAARDPWQMNQVGCQGATEFCDAYRVVQKRSEESARLNPGLAAVLGLVPGLGQVYAGRWLAGLGSFLLNGALIGAATAGYANREWAFAGLTTAVGVGVYAGSIYAGVEAAQRENDRREAALLKDLKGLPLRLQLLEIRL